jgi:hypothetical protein
MRMWTGVTPLTKGLACTRPEEMVSPSIVCRGATTRTAGSLPTASRSAWVSVWSVAVCTPFGNVTNSPPMSPDA